MNFLRFFTLAAVCAVTIVPSHAETDKNIPLAIGASQFSNLFLYGINRYVRQADYAMVSSDSICANLESGWVWDQDEFSVNHIGHPYQGSMYHVAGRANGLSFGESALITLGGSAVWELVYETETPSKNDLVTTTMGGLALGEMLHRLYLEADAHNIPGAFLVSPMDALNGLVSGSKPERSGEGITSGEISIEAGYLDSKKELDENRFEEADRNTVTGNLGIGIVYGDPFAHWTNTPYSHFEQKLDAVISPDYYAFSFFSDGLLFSRVPFDTANMRTTLGASLHYDFVYNSDINFSSNAVGFTVKHEQRLPLDSRLRLKAHVNWMPLAASDYVFLRFGNAGNPDFGAERRDYDMGTGGSVKAELSLSQPKAGTLDFSLCWYAMKTIPASVPEDGSVGTTAITIVKMAYEHTVWKNLASGISGTIYRKDAKYENAPDVEEQTSNVNFYVRYMLF